MADSPRTAWRQPAFRAPPPSPVAGHRNISPLIPVDDEFTGFLKRSRRVPQLILPHRFFQQEATPWSPPEVNLQSLMLPEKRGSEEKIIRSASSSLGCFQVVNHGIEEEVLLAALEAAEDVFRLHPEWKKRAARSPERNWGFEVGDAEDLGLSDEFFWWSGGAEKMAGVLDPGYSTFRDNMGHLSVMIERIAQKIELVLMESYGWRRDSNDIIVCIRKHKQNKEAFIDTGVAVDLNHHMLDALIRSLGSSHALGLHLFVGASSFRVYSKQAPMLFRPTDAAILVTIGDQVQAGSTGVYKHVIGKPEYQEVQSEPISIAFLHSYTSKSQAFTSFGMAGPHREEEKVISIFHQLIMATFFLLLFHIIVSVCTPFHHG